MGRGEDSRHPLHSLDALRGIAILCVVFSHLALAGQADGYSGIFVANLGVILFFFLSGFLIDRVLAGRPDLVTYAVRRALRIVPGYWMSLALVALTTSTWSFYQVVANGTFTAPVLGVERMLGIYWTLYIEVAFYCIAPLLWLVGDRAIKSAALVALVISLAVWGIAGRLPGAPFYLVFCFCGMLMGAHARGACSDRLVFVSIAAVSIATPFLLPQVPSTPIVAALIPAGCAFALAFCIRFNPRVPALEAIGIVSYSWYLLHIIFIEQIMSLGFPTWSKVIVVGSATLALSVVSYLLVERPAMRLGRNRPFGWTLWRLPGL